MPLMSTCLARLGSRFSFIFDPVRMNVHYGTLGLLYQSIGEMNVSVEDDSGNIASLPFTKKEKSFFIVDQYQKMCSLTFEAFSPLHGIKLITKIVAPFWPQDEKTSIIPAYIINFKIQKLRRVRWTKSSNKATFRGFLKFGIIVPNAQYQFEDNLIRMTYPVSVAGNYSTGEGGEQFEFSQEKRKNKCAGISSDMIMPLIGDWTTADDCLKIPFDLNAQEEQNFSIGLCSYCDSPLFERFGKAMQLKYISLWKNVDEVGDYLKSHYDELITKTELFESIWVSSSLSASAKNLSALSFQSYLMNTMWCTDDVKDWFSVWEGSCGYNSTVDVTYNEALFYFSCWPQLLEMIFDEWPDHVKTNSNQATKAAGAILEHDMGFGWTANGVSCHHQMPVEENSNFLLLLYAYAKWFGKESLFNKYSHSIKLLTEYLLCADTKGNGFPDIGTANTIDDANPAVQYGRDNVYLGIKRLAALHSAGRIFEYLNDSLLSNECKKNVALAIDTLSKNWLGDHWGVCLDKSAKGLVDCWAGSNLNCDTLPGWDAYSIYTSNGLLYLMMIDDMPPLNIEKLRTDIVNSFSKTLSEYGCGHSSLDKNNVWVSMNVWRDCIAGYLGENLLSNCDRYWNMQVFANSLGSEKPNCFSETYLNNNLVWYPRNAAVFGILFGMLRLKINGPNAIICPLNVGCWPIIPLTDWQNMKILFVRVDKADQNQTLNIRTDTNDNKSPFFILNSCNDKKN